MGVSLGKKMLREKIVLKESRGFLTGEVHSPLRTVS